VPKQEKTVFENLKVSALTGPSAKLNVEVLAIPVFKTANPIKTFAADLDKKLNGKLSAFCKAEKFDGDSGTQLIFSVTSGLKIKKIIVLGMGDHEKFSLHTLRKTAGHIAKVSQNQKVKSLAISIPMPEASQYRYSAAPEEIATVLTEGLMLGCYRFTAYKTQKKNPSELKSLAIYTLDSSLEKSLAQGVRRGQIHATCTAIARDLVNEPPNRANPNYLANYAKKLLSKTGVKVTILNPKQIKSLGMNTYLCVSQGSDQPPALIHLEYTPPRTKSTKRSGKGKGPFHLALIGKGVTFDSGGLSIKPAKSMETMKDDMAGGAAVIATMFGVSQIKPDVKVSGFILATENMINGQAVRPGDVVTSYLGKTVEILNTDAEGRLTLADALAYAQNFKPDQMIDIATLTGACLVALGDSISAILGNSRDLTEKVIEAGKRAGETFWEMPLFEDYRPALKSDIADLRNIGGNYGGTITAALFLSEFVAKSTAWAHLDIAGPAWTEKDADFFSKGGTGVGVRTFLNYISSLNA